MTFEMRRYIGLSEKEKDSYRPLVKVTESKNTANYMRFNKYCKHPEKYRLIVDWEQHWDHFPSVEEIVETALSYGEGAKL
jgi:hypothetical protein